MGRSRRKFRRPVRTTRAGPWGPGPAVPGEQGWTITRTWAGSGPRAPHTRGIGEDGGGRAQSYPPLSTSPDSTDATRPRRTGRRGRGHETAAWPRRLAGGRTDAQGAFEEVQDAWSRTEGGGRGEGSLGQEGGCAARTKGRSTRDIATRTPDGRALPLMFSDAPGGDRTGGVMSTRRGTGADERRRGSATGDYGTWGEGRGGTRPRPPPPAPGRLARMSGRRAARGRGGGAEDATWPDPEHREDEGPRGRVCG